MSLREELERHPGSSAHSCPLRVRVTAQSSSEHSSGYACGFTGGHCIPGDYCARRCDEIACLEALRNETLASLTEASE
jgi:hypothetical protein